MDRALINPIDRYEKPVTRIGQQAVGPGTKPTFGWACVLEAELGHFVKCVYKLSLLCLVTIRSYCMLRTVYPYTLRRCTVTSFHTKLTYVQSLTGIKKH